MEKKRLEDIAEIDKDVNNMAERLRKEGYEFELEFPNENMIILEAGGRTMNFTKLRMYDIANEAGQVISHKKIEDVIESEIKKLATKGA